MWTVMTLKWVCNVSCSCKESFSHCHLAGSPLNSHLSESYVDGDITDMHTLGWEHRLQFNGGLLLWESKVVSYIFVNSVHRTKGLTIAKKTPWKVILNRSFWTYLFQVDHCWDKSIKCWFLSMCSNETHNAGGEQYISNLWEHQRHYFLPDLRIWQPQWELKKKNVSKHWD